LEFAWDAVKAAQNFAKHGVLFKYAVELFLDPNRIDRKDSRRDYSEVRYISLGMIEGRLFAVVYTQRGSAVRLISARKANDREQRQYDNSLST
jgi:uncharacterized DUF497 family protein